MHHLKSTWQVSGSCNFLKPSRSHPESNCHYSQAAVQGRKREVVHRDVAFFMDAEARSGAVHLVGHGSYEEPRVDATCVFGDFRV